MKKLFYILFVVAAVLALTHRVDAIQATLATKQITISFTVTPSPIVYVPMNANGRIAKRPLPSPMQFASMIAYDPSSLEDVVAQATPQSSVKVNFTVKPDPTYQYFHLIPVNTSLNAGYGSNSWTCAFKIFGSYSTAWQIEGYAYGSSSSGNTAGLGGYPLYNYPTTSDLSWLAEGITSSFVAYANDGPPGQQTVTGVAGATKTVCIDLQLSVPSTISAGSYSATISYRMVHN